MAKKNLFFVKHCLEKTQILVWTKVKGAQLLKDLFINSFIYIISPRNVELVMWCMFPSLKIETKESFFIKYCLQETL